MSEIAKCPLCGNVQIEVLNEHNMPDGAYCCGVRCASIKKWNQYAAAMELAKAGVWAGECEEQRDYMDDVTSNRDAWRSIVNLDLEANDEACMALKRCEDVFNG